MNNKYHRLLPLFVLLYFFIHFITDYFYFLDTRAVLWSVIKYIFVIAVLYLCGRRIFRDKEKFTLGFTTVLFIYLFFGSIADTLSKIKLFNPANNVYLKLTILFAVMAIIIIVAVRLLPQTAVKKLLKAWLLYLIIVTLYDCAGFFISGKPEKKYLSPAPQINLAALKSKPDVYFMVFDMYPSHKIYQKYFGFDNSYVENNLSARDFYVTRNGTSIYDATYYSLSSTLNLQGLSYYNDSTIADYKKILIALKNVRHAVLPTAFESAGYDFNNYSVFNLQRKPSPLKFNLWYHLDNILTSTTFFNRLYNEFEPDFLLANRNIDLRFLKRSWSDNIKEDTKMLIEQFKTTVLNHRNSDKPSFNYFHFMLPHPPAIFDSSGKENPVSEMYGFRGFEKAKEKYISYTKYTNKLMTELADLILQKAGWNTVIIIQGDHGYREFSDILPEEVRYGIFNAVYLPEKNYGGFNDSLNPIQTFKLILRNQFGTTVN